MILAQKSTFCLLRIEFKAKIWLHSRGVLYQLGLPIFQRSSLGVEKSLKLPVLSLVERLVNNHNFRQTGNNGRIKSKYYGLGYKLVKYKLVYWKPIPFFNHYQTDADCTFTKYKTQQFICKTFVLNEGATFTTSNKVKVTKIQFSMTSLLKNSCKSKQMLFLPKKIGSHKTLFWFILQWLEDEG